VFTSFDTTVVEGAAIGSPALSELKGRCVAKRSELARRQFPCDECPFRADNRDNPKSKFPAERWEALSVTVRDPLTGHQPMPGDILFGCHKGEPGTDADLACAGWLAQFGSDHVGVRLAIAQGRLPDSALEPGVNWPPLHENWADVVQAQTSPGVDQPSGVSADHEVGPESL
jgi:Family of unknown function (DUF6283)